MLDFENGANPYEDRRISISPWRNLAIVDVSGSEVILSQARRMREFGFRDKDAIHLACAIEAGCSVFPTTDASILKKAAFISNLAIINPVDFDFTSPSHDD